MIDVNLLKKRGIFNSTNKDDFSVTDNDLDKMVDDKIEGSKTTEVMDDDFESNYNKRSNKTKSTKSQKLAIILLLLLIVSGGYYYFQFYMPTSHQISSSHIKELIFYTLDNEEISIESIKFNNNNLEFNLKISPTSFNEYKVKIGQYFDKMKSSSYFDYILSNQLLTIKSSDNVTIINDKFNQSISVQEFKPAAIIDIDKDRLKKAVDSIFNINNANLIDFNISPSRDLSYSLYNILLSK
tara:strand:- start:2146 stop:2865 length:720 start_codon:yes stop_codon:yes gene_type:complete